VIVTAGLAGLVLAMITLAGCERPGYAQQGRASATPRLTAAAADPALIRRGREVFVNGPCLMCHTIRGTAARATVGPNLTHLASRATIAAGTVPNTRGHLAGWILNPQNLKPGTVMPPTLLAPRDLTALLTFLESLE
jgi:cytochrome c oxidase subunit 2